VVEKGAATSCPFFISDFISEPSSFLMTALVLKKK
jgi:hypothetical protein